MTNEGYDNAQNAMLLRSWFMEQTKVTDMAMPGFF